MSRLPPAKLRPAFFGVILVGQTASQLGSQLTQFVLGVWVYQTTGSATQFALIAFFVSLPQILLLPVVGALIDRWDRRWTMILSDSGAGAITLILLWLVWTDRLEVGYIYLTAAASSTFSTFQAPTLAASTPLMVPNRHLTRANGLVELGSAMAMLIAPAAAGFLLGAVGIGGVILIDITTFVFAVGTLLLVRIPRPPKSEEVDEQAPSLLRETVYGWIYLRQRRGLVALLVMFACVNLTAGMVQISLTPLVLSFASSRELGVVLSIGVAGMVAGSLGIVAWGGPRRRLPTIFGLLAFQGAILFLGGVRPSMELIATAAFAYMFCIPVVMACSNTIWQTKVAPEVHGRVFATRRLVATSSMPLAFLVAGPLADYVFEPLLAADGALAGSVGRIIGTGPGRGVGLLFICLGLFALIVLAAGFSYRPLRRLEKDLPDVVVETAGEA